VRKKKYVRNFTEYRKDLEVKIKVFLEKLSEQGDDAKESAYILQKYMSGGNVTKEEEGKVKECFFDILKMAGIGIPFILIPGASLLIPAIIHVAKKYKINLLPSAFNEKLED